MDCNYYVGQQVQYYFYDVTPVARRVDYIGGLSLIIAFLSDCICILTRGPTKAKSYELPKRKFSFVTKNSKFCLFCSCFLFFVFKPPTSNFTAKRFTAVLHFFGVHTLQCNISVVACLFIDSTRLLFKALMKCVLIFV